MDPGSKNILCYPNPFREKITISFTLEEKSNIEIMICDLAGRQNYILANALCNQGKQSFEWKGTNNEHEYLSPGMYFCLIKGSNFQITKKIVLLNR